MITPIISGSSRREFLGRIIPACAVTCLGFKPLFLSGQTQPPPAQPQAQPAHKFDAELPRKPTWRQIFIAQYAAAYIPFLKHCVKELGQDKTITLLKAYADESAVEGAKSVAKRLGKNDFAALKNFFNPANPIYANALTMTVAESTDRVHELHVTECLWAKTFLDAEAGDLGYAGICWGDYSFARNFNPQIEMVRTKTLMQGDDCCNHRYLWKG